MFQIIWTTGEGSGTISSKDRANKVASITTLKELMKMEPGNKEDWPGSTNADSNMNTLAHLTIKTKCMAGVSSALFRNPERTKRRVWRLICPRSKTRLRQVLFKQRDDFSRKLREWLQGGIWNHLQQGQNSILQGRNQQKPAPRSWSHLSQRTKNWKHLDWRNRLQRN